MKRKTYGSKMVANTLSLAEARVHISLSVPKKELTNFSLQKGTF